MREFNFLTAHGEALSVIARRPYINTGKMASASGGSLNYAIILSLY